MRAFVTVCDGQSLCGRFDLRSARKRADPLALKHGTCRSGHAQAPAQKSISLNAALPGFR
jgi:hypothetical protein